MDAVKTIIVDYSLEGTNIQHEITTDGHLLVRANGMVIKSKDKITKNTNLNALALAMYSEGVKILRCNHKTIWICVYKETVKDHDEDNNLMEIEVTTEFAKQYFEECIKTSECEFTNSFEEFLENYTADDTMNFYDYAKKHNAILDSRDW